MSQKAPNKSQIIPIEKYVDDMFDDMFKDFAYKGIAPKKPKTK